MKTKAVLAIFCCTLSLCSVGVAQLELTTTFASNNGASGNMFDVVTNQKLAVRGFQVNLDAGTHDIEIYMRNTAGSFQPVAQDPSAWTRIGRYEGVQSSGPNVPTVLPDDLFAVLPGGQTRGFYVVVRTGSNLNYTNGTGIGNVVASNFHLAILEGVGVSGYFGTSFNERIWNGTLRYSPVLDVPSPITSIQSRINIAPNGWMVLVQSGTYFENLDFLGKEVAVVAANGPATTTVDGGSAGPVVSFVSSENRAAVLRGFTLRNGLGGVEQGGGIDIDDAGPTILSCVIENNQGGLAAGGFQTTSCAGGVHIDGLEEPLIQDCTIRNNQGGAGISVGIGGAGGVWSRRFVTLRDCRIESNVGGGNVGARGGPGGMGCGSLGNHVIQRTVFSGNDGGNGSEGGTGGLHTQGDSATQISACKFRANQGGNATTGVGGAGGVSFVNGGSSLEGSFLSQNHGGNSVSGQGGPGAVLVSGDTGARVLNCSIAANSPGVGGAANGPGGILYFRMINSGSSLVNSIVWGNFGASLLEIQAPLNQGYPQVSFCNIAGGWAGGTNLIDANPVFVDLAAGDLHLHVSSPCIDLGDANAFALADRDIDGEERVINGNPDLGADEVGMPFLSGTDEDLRLQVFVNGSTAFTAQAGDLLEIRLDSPFGTRVGDVPLLFAQLYPNGGTLPGNLAGIGFPEVHVELSELIILFDGTQPFGPFPQYLLPSSGLNSLSQVLPAFAGKSIRLQGAALTPNAKNGFFVTTGAIDLAFL